MKQGGRSGTGCLPSPARTRATRGEECVAMLVVWGLMIADEGKKMCYREGRWRFCTGDLDLWMSGI